MWKCVTTGFKILGFFCFFLIKRTRLVIEVEDAVVRLQKVRIRRRQVSTDGQRLWDLFGLLHPHNAVIL